MKQTDMAPAKVSQRLRRVAQMRTLCLKLSAAGRKASVSLRTDRSREKRGKADT